MVERFVEQYPAIVAASSMRLKKKDSLRSCNDAQTRTLRGWNTSWSTAGDIVSAERATLHPDNVNMLLFLNKNT
ncbi:hypothetical protein KUCAC02_010884 [Chaenocephalus aceratus]|uniref:Uncharacterized protein n=1 Tax=Chaenocephalus aceratus TaxID=36190 RepID=A0ACB9WUN1_CHAAC|nr:hypothetical protein KUCAC02_010884 [Chaenocephalus aceratus]